MLYDTMRLFNRAWSKDRRSTDYSNGLSKGFLVSYDPESPEDKKLIHKMNVSLRDKMLMLKKKQEASKQPMRKRLSKTGAPI
mmetsp:Transcript_5884/g.9530  ORF Transcript_5884/g.9530 Transcript_5884/m.9530 type:complete len:82 (-) Transcript_5884:1481-1726(-)